MSRWAEYLNNFSQIKKQGFLLLALVIGAALIIFSSIHPVKSTPEAGQIPMEKNPPVVQDDTALSKLRIEENLIAQKLDSILSNAAGVGEVEVTVKLASSTASNYAYNTNVTEKTTEEKDQAGGNRTIKEESRDNQVVLTKDDSGLESPIVENETAPSVQGVLVVAEGAEDSEIKAQLIYAIQAYLDIPVQRIIVLPKGSR